ncbi:hypothetical protein V8B97DRAFT_1919570 [Scleroderma yunnanense]
MVVLDPEKSTVLRNQTEAVEDLNNGLAGACIADVVADLLSTPRRFVYTFSILSEPKVVTTKILDALPSDPRKLSSSFVPKLLLEVSAFFFSLPADVFLSNTSRTIGQYTRYLTDVWPVLSILSSLCLPDVSIHSTSAKRGSLSTSDMATLRKFGVKIPSNTDEAAETTNGIMNFLRQILSFYLELLSEPRFRSHCQTAYFNASHQECGDPNPEMNVFTEEKDQEQSLHAALHIHDVDGFGEWQVVLSSRATKCLRELRRRDGKAIKCVLKKIRQLSRGEFSGNNYKMLNGPSHGVPIYEAEIFSNLRLVVERQVFCRLNFLKPSRYMAFLLINNLIACGKALVDNSPDEENYIVTGGVHGTCKCTLRERARPGTDVYSPASFLPSNEEGVTQLSPATHSYDSSEVAPFITLPSYEWFEIGWTNTSSYPSMSGLLACAKEWEIVQCATSCFVIGRSGTGKTTSILFKMLAIQRAWEKAPETPKPRQVFVTKSPILAAKVEECYTDLMGSLALAGCSHEELRELRFRNDEEKPSRMIDPLNAMDCRPGTPRKFSELEDHDFPLFVTFDQLARMIAVDLQNDLSTLDANDPAIYILPKIIDGEDSFVTYNIFKGAYWPRLPQPMTKGLAPSLVFSEFMVSGVIKGSEKAFHRDRFLDRQAYVNLPSRAYPVFAHDRDGLYSLFESYNRLKRKCGDYDPADSQDVHDPEVVSTGLWRYVDEAQDNLIIDVLLLRTLCRKADGLLWAGDTAQTISAGSSFRFEDLKGFIYRIEADGKMPIEKSRQSKPTTFQLVVNYRSHSGIINCARAVVDLITMFWPDTIDILQSEHGLIGGLLVRDDAARTQFKKEIGVKGIILTLQESKGLEFDDVGTFYGHITYQAETLLPTIPSGGLSFGHVATKPILSNLLWGMKVELKNLYVGITRAKMNLYLLDNSEMSKPMQEFWTKLGLIRDADSHTDTLQYFSESSREQWAATGHKLFNSGHFEQAIHCFERADLSRERQIAGAFQLREEARSIIQPSERRKAFHITAEAFEKCAEEAVDIEGITYYRDAAKCYALAGNIHEAANFYIKSEDFASAARQYQKAGYFDDIVRFLKHYDVKMPIWCKAELLEICVRHYYGASKLLRPPIPLFSSTEEELKYLEGKDLHEPRILILQSKRRFVEAADIELSRNNPIQAIRLFLRDLANKVAIQRAADVALENIWQECSFGLPVQTKLRQKGSHARRIVESIQEIPLEYLSISDSDQIRLFQAIHQSTSFDESYQIGHEFLRRGDEAIALLVFDMRISTLLDQGTLSRSSAELTAFFNDFGIYARLLTSLMSRNLPLSDDQRWRRVFAINELPGQRYSVYEGTFLFKKFASNHFTLAELNLRWKEKLGAHLRRNVLVEQELCHDHCPDRLSCSDEHLSKSSLSAVQYNMKVNVHLQQIRILDFMYSALPQEQGWNKWIYETVNWLEPGDRPHDYLMDLLRLARLGSAFSGQLSLIGSVSRQARRVSYGDLRCGQGPDDNVAGDIVISLDGSNRTSISRGASVLCFLLWEPDFPVDLTTVCDYMEEICSEIVISSRLSLANSLESAFHDIVVPRRWIQNPNKLSSIKDLSSLRLLLSWKKFNLLRNARPMLDITAAKLYRMLCIASSELRRSSYLATIQSFDRGGTIHDMVHLVHKNRHHTTGFVSSTITRLVYENVADIPRLLTQFQEASS